MGTLRILPAASVNHASSSGHLVPRLPPAKVSICCHVTLEFFPDLGLYGEFGVGVGGVKHKQPDHETGKKGSRTCREWWWWWGVWGCVRGGGGSVFKCRSAPLPGSGVSVSHPEHTYITPAWWYSLPIWLVPIPNLFDLWFAFKRPRGENYLD